MGFVYSGIVTSLTRFYAMKQDSLIHDESQNEIIIIDPIILNNSGKVGKDVIGSKS